jgi:hypothetical protein
MAAVAAEASMAAVAAVAPVAALAAVAPVAAMAAVAAVFFVHCCGYIGSCSCTDYGIIRLTIFWKEPNLYFWYPIHNTSMSS